VDFLDLLQAKLKIKGRDDPARTKGEFLGKGGWFAYLAKSIDVKLH